MRTLKLTLLLSLVMTTQPAWSTPIYFEVENLGGDTWQYTYTAGNDTGDLIDLFTIFFDPLLYAFDLLSSEPFPEVDPAIYDGPSGWDIFVAAPDLLFPGPEDDQPGLYDAFSFDGILPGDEVGGFSIVFQWLGDGTPGAQPFTLYGFDLPLDLTGYDLFTEMRPVTAVPEPGTLALFGAGLLALTVLRRRRSSQADNSR